MSTGDLGHFDGHGRLFIDGRDDDMIVSGGENVFPQEVEDLLARPSRRRRRRRLRGERPGLRPAARRLRRAGAGRVPVRDELREYVRARLARHKVPREIRFVDELPRTSTGKVKRRELSARFDADTADLAG